VGKKREKKLIVLIVTFLVTCLLVYKPSGKSEPVHKGHSLREMMDQINGYSVANAITLDDNTYRFLDLDDYTFGDYQGRNGLVNLFIGFYYTTDKISAAHSPLACFPGQGWTITRPAAHELKVGTLTIHYAEITATREGQKELVLYWYQAFHDTTPYVYRNKIDALYNKLAKQEQQNAFVRVSMPMENSTYAQAKKAGTDFMKVFYPKFIEYIDQS
jgi:EpsI family protein